jgi:hypothetical protein
VKKLFADALAMSISPQPVTLSDCSAESGATTSAASPGTIILVLLVLLGGAYVSFAPAGAADKAEL